MLTLDHFAIACSELDAGSADLSEAIGVDLAPGGEHVHMGTHNRLLSLGAEEYLEIIAIDPNGTAPPQPRWFDLDNFAGQTRPTTWICRCPDLEAAISAAPPGIGVPWALSRADLRWSMAVPQDGKLPFDGLFPALITWQGDAHPAPRLPDRGVRLTGLILHSPDAPALRTVLSSMITDARLTVRQSAAPRLEVELSTPSGRITL